jgi:hypothetical protein
LTDIASDLQTRYAERAAMLERLVKQLEADPRVVAAWLYGSLGRGDDDALSDIDVRVVVADAHIEAMNADRQAYATRIGLPLLIQEAPGNAPPGGAFLLVMYEGTVGPIQVDWTWQPQSQACIPPDVHMLFDRAGLPHDPPVTRPTGQALAETLTEQSVFFWMMVQVAVKKAARQQAWAAIIVLNYVQQTLDGVKWLLSLTDRLPQPENRRKGRLPAHPAEQMAYVRALAAEMKALTPQITVLGGRVPNEVIQPAYRYFDLIEMVIANLPPDPFYVK